MMYVVSGMPPESVPVPTISPSRPFPSASNPTGKIVAICAARTTMIGTLRPTNAKIRLDVVNEHTERLRRKASDESKRNGEHRGAISARWDSDGEYRFIYRKIARDHRCSVLPRTENQILVEEG